MRWHNSSATSMCKFSSRKTHHGNLISYLFYWVTDSWISRLQPLNREPGLQGKDLANPWKATDALFVPIGLGEQSLCWWETGFVIQESWRISALLSARRNITCRVEEDADRWCHQRLKCTIFYRIRLTSHITINLFKRDAYFSKSWVRCVRTGDLTSICHESVSSMDSGIIVLDMISSVKEEFSKTSFRWSQPAARLFSFSWKEGQNYVLQTVSLLSNPDLDLGLSCALFIIYRVMERFQSFKQAALPRRCDRGKYANSNHDWYRQGVVSSVFDHFCHHFHERCTLFLLLPCCEGDRRQEIKLCPYLSRQWTTNRYKYQRPGEKKQRLSLYHQSVLDLS